MERRRGIVPYANFDTVREILARAARGRESDRGSAWKAAGRLWEHCTPECDSDDSPVILHEVHAQLYHTLFGLERPTDASVLSTCREMLAYLTATQTLDPPESMPPALGSFADWCEKEEAQFLSDVFDAPLREIAPKADDWTVVARNVGLRSEAERFIAGKGARIRAHAIVVDLARKAALPRFAWRVSWRVARLLEAYPAPFALFDDLMGRIALGPMSRQTARDKCGNWKWDFNICFVASPYLRINGAPCLLVTNDRGIRTAAKTARVPESVASFDQYLRMLGLPLSRDRDNGR